MAKVVIDVIGNTAPLKKGLNDAKSQVNEFATGFTSGAAKATIAAAAVYTLSRNLESLGGKAGKIGQAFSSLSTGNIVGFVKGIQSLDEVNIPKLTQNLLDAGSASKALDASAKLSAIGLDKAAGAARNAAYQIGQMKSVTDAAIISVNLLAAGSNEAAAFGERSGIYGRSTGGINAQNNAPGTGLKYFEASRGGKGPMARRGITQSQRNQWFDSRISRELDRVQDVQTLKGQVSALNAIAAEIQKRINATKDITRKLNLEDQLVRVNRQRRGVEDLMLEKAKKIKKAAKEIKDLGGPLTKTTQLSASILAGLGLSARDERILTARLSHFNSAGTALAGAGGGSITFHSTTVVDGKAIAKTSSKYNRRTRNVNTSQRNGPNAGGYTGRG